MRLTRQISGDVCTRRRSGIWLPQGAHARPERPTFIDLFCGCGGFSLGFLQAGWQGLVAVDDDQIALATYWFNLCDVSSRWVGPSTRRDKMLNAGSGWLHNSGKPQGIPPVQVVVCKTVEELTGKYLLSLVGRDVGEIDCVIGSPPCQGFSVAGRRRITDSRNMLVFEFMRLVHEINPRTYVMENVPGIKSMRLPSGQKVMDALRAAGAERGYAVALPKLETAVAGREVISGVRMPKRKIANSGQLSLPLE